MQGNAGKICAVVENLITEFGYGFRNIYLSKPRTAGKQKVRKLCYTAADFNAAENFVFAERVCSQLGNGVGYLDRLQRAHIRKGVLTDFCYG